MKLNIYQVDAFTSKLFSGNPAAVCPLDKWPEDALLQNIAAENNLAETAFYIRTEEGFHIRWFTPLEEVDLCGHATLATAYVLFNVLHHPGDLLQFKSRSGLLTVSRNGGLLTLNFPVDSIRDVSITPELESWFNKKPVEVYRGRMDYMFVFESQEDIETIVPDLAILEKLAHRGVIVTAPGTEVDFVSRFFAPSVGIPEDPVTGSAHTTLAPYWSGKLGKKELTARQISSRGGYLKCTMNGERIEISGQAVLYLEGVINLAI